MSTSADESAAATSRGDLEEQTSKSRRLRSSEVINMYNLSRLVRELGTREQGVAFAEEHGLIMKSKQCRVHRTPMRIIYSKNETVGSFICNKGSCKTKSSVSRCTGTWFENVRMTMPRIYYLMYAFAHGWSFDKTIWEDIAREERCLSSSTISDWFGYCRKAIAIFQSEKQEYKGKIGGPGKTVQIDESKFGKRKYEKGQQGEGHWVLGMIEDGSEDLRLEICLESKPTLEVLVPLIKKHVEVGTTIRTGGWIAYNGLSDHGFHHEFNHRKFNASEEADEGTQKKNSQWRVVKDFFSKENYSHSDNLVDLIIEYMWRRNVVQQKKDPFIELINVIRDVYGPNKEMRKKYNLTFVNVCLEPQLEEPVNTDDDSSN